MDKRWYELASHIVNTSLHIKKGERVMIAMIEIESFDLAKAIYQEIVKVGGYPQVQLLSEEFKHALLRYGNEDQISWVPEIELMGMEWADVYIGLRGAHNLHELSDISNDKLAKQQVAMGKISAARWKNTRWVLVRIPNDAFAVEAKCDFETVQDMFFDSCVYDYDGNREKWDRYIERLNGSKKVRVVGKKTDLTFSVEGRKWIGSFFSSNIPDGEIFTAPVTSTVDGTIYFEHPGVLGGRLMHDITLTWKNGVLVDASCSTEEEYFKSIIYNNKGADKIGEFALGINKAMNRFCNDILFDEKIYGTIHIALGRAYPEAGGVNESSIHWDIIKDTRLPGSAVYVDDRLILKDGEFIF